MNYVVKVGISQTMSWLLKPPLQLRGDFRSEPQVDISIFGVSRLTATPKELGYVAKATSQRSA